MFTVISLIGAACFICFLVTMLYHAINSDKDVPVSSYVEKLEKQAAYIQAVESQNEALRCENANFNNDNVRLREDFERIQHQKISADVKMGQKSEVLLPFLHDFPYKDDEIKGMFQPIDLIVFRPDEIVFVEIKTGASALSEKQKNIRRIIKEGKVKFEVHRMNEKGVSVK